MSDTVPVLAQIPPASLSWMDHVRQMEADAESRRQERIAERAASQADHRAAEEARRDERRHPRRNRREISAENGQAVISAGRMVASDLPIQGELDDITEEVETAWRKLVASKSLARTTALAMEIQRLMVQASDVMRRHESAINNTLARQYDLSANNGKVSPENNRPYAGLAGLGEIVDADTPSRVLQPKHERRGEKTIRNWARAQRIASLRNLASKNPRVALISALAAGEMDTAEFQWAMARLVQPPRTTTEHQLARLRAVIPSKRKQKEAANNAKQKGKRGGRK